jgi:hypothetical protein
MTKPAKPVTPAHRLALALRLLAAIPGGYALSASAVAMLGGLLAGAGQQRSEAVVLSAMLGFVFYLVFLVWAFAQRSVIRLWACTGGGIAICLAALQLMNTGG